MLKAPAPSGSVSASSAASRPAIGKRGSGACCTGCGGGPPRGRWRSRSGTVCSSSSRPRTASSMTRTAPRSSARASRLRRGLGFPPKRRRRPRQHRTRRPRHPALGALVLVDGSVFDWLGTGTPLFLLGAIDDATGTVLALHFRPAEDLHGYLTLLRRLAEAYGFPPPPHPHPPPP